MAVNKVVFGQTTLIDLTSDTVAPQYLAEGYTAHDRSGALITGTATGSDPAIWQDANGYVHVSDTAEVVEVYADDDGYVVLDLPSDSTDFIVTLAYNDQTELWEPDCTFAEASAAYSGGKTIAFASDPIWTCAWFVANESPLVLGYVVHDEKSSMGGAYFDEQIYIWDSSGITLDESTPLYDTSRADAQPSDVAQGMVFFNAYGRQYGTYVTPTARTSSDVTVSGDTVTVPAGAYASQVTKSVASGTAGTPTATKGAVSNHAVSVTPSVTNSTGYITGGTKTGTAVTVSASELVSGTLNITSSGTNDVTNYASASVAAGSATASATKGSVSNHSVTVTPSVTRTAGYVTAGTADGTAVSVSASELVSGTLNVAQNGTVDVTNYASASVNVQGGDDSNYARTVSRSGAITSIPSVTSIGDYAYYGCTGLSVSSLPSGLTSVGPYAFQGCTGLTISALPSGLTSIGNGAFMNSGITIDTIPSSVTSIGTSAFADCKSIEEIEIPSGISSIGASTFSACWNLESVTIPSTVTSIGQNAFFQCVSLTDVTALGAITSIGTNAFTTNTNTSTTMQLAHVAFPNATISSLSTTFGSTTAYNACQNLESADLGKTSTIAANAFANCYKLQTLVLRKTSVCTLGNVSGLLNTPMRGYNGLTGTVYVPSSLVATYKTATNWSTLYNDGTLTFAAIEGSVWEL